MGQWSYAASVFGFCLLGTMYGIVGVSIGASVAIFVSFWIGLAIVGMRNHIPLRPTLMAMLRFGGLSLLLLALLSGTKLALAALHLPDFAMILAVSAVAGLLGLAVTWLRPSFLGEDGEQIWSLLISRFRRRALAGS